MPAAAGWRVPLFQDSNARLPVAAAIGDQDRRPAAARTGQRPQDAGSTRSNPCAIASPTVIAGPHREPDHRDLSDQRRSPRRSATATIAQTAAASPDSVGGGDDHAEDRLGSTTSASATAPIRRPSRARIALLSSHAFEIDKLLIALPYCCAGLMRSLMRARNRPCHGGEWISQHDIEWRVSDAPGALCGGARVHGAARRGDPRRDRDANASGCSNIRRCSPPAPAPTRPSSSIRSDFPVFEAGRGGRYTYHGPGQRVGYVMLDLEKRGKDIRCFVHALEGWMIDTLGTARRCCAPRRRPHRHLGRRGSKTKPRSARWGCA